VDIVIDSPPNQELFTRGYDDARSIIVSKDTGFHSGTIVSDIGDNLDTVLDIDEELMNSGPYLAHYRKLISLQFKKEHKRESAVEERQISIRTSQPPDPGIADKSLNHGDTKRLSRSYSTPKSPPNGDQLEIHRNTQLFLRKQAWRFSSHAKSKVEKLYQAAKAGDVRKIFTLLDSGAFVNGFSNGETPLNAAVENKHVQVAELLLERGANVRLGVDTRYTSRDYISIYAPIHIAAVVGSVDLIKLLVKYGANVNDASGREASTCHITPLHIATGDTANLLIILGGDKFAPTSMGHFPIHTAAVFGSCKAIETHLNHGAPIDPTDDEGTTPLELCCMFASDQGYNDDVKFAKIARFLIQRGAKVPRHSLLHEIIEDKKLDKQTNPIVKLVKVLCEAGLDPNYVRKYKRRWNHEDQGSRKLTALGLLCSRFWECETNAIQDYIQLASVLIAGGAQIDITDTDNDTNPGLLVLLVESFCTNGGRLTEASAELDRVLGFVEVLCFLISKSTLNPDLNDIWLAEEVEKATQTFAGNKRALTELKEMSEIERGFHIRKLAALIFLGWVRHIFKSPNASNTFESGGSERFWAENEDFRVSFQRLWERAFPKPTE
jgi:ankyrin repeat protein